MTFTKRELAREADREASYRRFVYSRLIGEGKLDGVTAERRIAMMEVIAEQLHGEAEAEEPQGRLL